MSINIERPERLEVSFGGYSGKAGIDRGQVPWRVAFVGKRSDYRGVETGTVDGQAVRVTNAEASALVKGMVVLTVQPEVQAAPRA